MSNEMSSANRLLTAIVNMQDNEYLVYSKDYDSLKVVQEGELTRTFGYQGEIHVCDRDYGQEAYEVLEDMFVNGASLDLPADLRQRIAAIVNPTKDVTGLDVYSDDIAAAQQPRDPLLSKRR